MAQILTRIRRLSWSIALLGTLGSGTSTLLRAEDATPANSSSTSRTEDLERRVRELEEIVRRLEAERKPAARDVPSAPTAPVAPTLPVLQPTPEASSGNASEPPRGSSPRADVGDTGHNFAVDKPSTPLAGFSEDRGFYLRSADDRFNLRITGQVQGDYRGFLDRVDYTDPDSFLVRRARLGIEANLFKYYEFRLLPDFSNAQGPGTTTPLTKLQDGYLNVHYWDAFQFEVGKFKQPFSYEQLIQDRYVPTLERSLIDQLVPARDEGIMIHGQNLLGGRLDYAVSISNGEINGDYDTNKLKDFAGRIAVRPFKDSEMLPFLNGLQVGFAATAGVEEENISPGTIRTPATVPWLTFNSTTRANGMRTRYSPEVAYFCGPLGFAAQYYDEHQDMSPAFSGPGSNVVLNVPTKGFYVLSTLFLTGEERTTYSQQIKPRHDFDPCCPFTHPGAWELVGRVSQLTYGDEVFKPIPVGRGSFVTLADPTKFATGATEMTLGFNWYLNAWVRMQFNWEHSWFNSPVRLGPGPAGLLNHQDALITRLQFIF